MSEKSLEDLITASGSVVEMLRNSQSGPNVYPGVKPEYTNWRDEQTAWQKTAVLFNQSYHMADLAVEGPDAFKLLNHLAPNSFKGFVPNRAKQFAPVSHDGYLIGDVIMFYLAENKFNLVGRAPALEWVQFHAATGKWDVKVELDQRTALRSDGKRKLWRYQVQGPYAMQVLEKALSYKPEDLKFFHMTPVKIAGKPVLALRHGMSGQPGWELMGPWEDADAVLEALVKAGEEYGMRLVGGRAYSTNALESGWIPSPLPAIYSGDAMKPYRQWLTAKSYEAAASLGGSFISDDIEDYYLTPWDIGYGGFMKFDHDFIGRDALQKRAEQGGHRKKVTLALNNDDVTRTFATMFNKQVRAKYFDSPSAVYCMHLYDQVLSGSKKAGISTWIGYSANEGKMLTLAILDEEFAQPGNEVTLIWGEPNGGTRKPTVEPHVQTEIRGIVSPSPYTEVVRSGYAPGGWRAAAQS
jgi:glycine cleavage system aminomethyltransferase T